MTAQAHRLATHARPLRYHLHIRASPDQPRFHGTARIEVELDQPLQELEVHARELAFTKVAAEDGRVHGSAEVRKATESAVLRFARPLPRGKQVLELAWEAPVSPGMVGLYLSKDGPEQCLVTQCEATDARAIFPCWDEPAFKAVLQWTVTTPKGLTVLANGPLVAKQDEPDGWVTWRFAPTPPLSAYLAAIAIGKFGSTPETQAQGVPFRVWAMEGKEHLGVDARDAAARLLPWFADYFGVPYRFGKYDQIAVPSFSFGAMENAGLVVFRASRLLMDPRTASWRDRRDITLVVSHEFAHQWFGNHVTMRWWDDLWLNESFAEWIAHKAVEGIWPEQEVWVDFQGRTTRALATDALGATHPIYQPVATPAEAAELFDAITYGKGSAVLRMLEAFLGDTPFRAGLRAYMRAFGGANAAGADLWRHLGEAARRPVADIMQAWVGQPGHPVLRAALRGSTLHLKQERYRSRPGASGGDQRWPVPMVVRWRDDAGVRSQPFLLERSEGELPLPVQGNLRWVHLNADDLGFYRTDPDPAMLGMLREHVGELTAPERAGLLRDQWGLVRSGARPPAGAFQLLEAATRGEPHYAVLEMAGDIARDAERLLEVQGDEAAVQGLRAWARRAFQPAMAELGPDARPGEHPSDGLARAAAYRGLAGVGRDPKALEAAMALAEQERRDAASVDPNLAGVVVGLAAQQGDAARFEAHLQAYVRRRDAKSSPQEADRYLGSFLAFRPPELVQRTLKLLEDGTVPKQSVGPLLGALLREPHAQALAWPRTRDRWPVLRKELGDSWAANLAEAMGALPPRLKPEAEAFLAEHAKDLVQSRARALDLLGERELVFQRVVPGLAAWAKQGPRS